LKQINKGFSTSSLSDGLEIVNPLIGLTNDQINYYQLAKSFADKEIKPFADIWNEDSEFPIKTYHKLAELGFAGIFVKDDVGGSNLSR
jgi:alkylation response protein AidB-like acyl-CoA dehydrogenase